MKKTLLFILLLSPVAAAAQTTVYHPFPEDTVVWRENCDGLGFSCNCSCTGGVCVNASNRQYYYGNDTVIGGLTYHKLMLDSYNMDHWMGPIVCQPGCNFSPHFYSYVGSYVGAIRQDAGLKKVYIYPQSSAGEMVLYDYDLQVGDTLDQTYTNITTFNMVSVIDSVLVGTNYHKRFWLWDINAPAPGPNDTGYVALIEGIGSTFGLLEPLVPPFEYICAMLCVSVDSVTIYPPGATNCNFMTSGLPAIENHEHDVVIKPNPVSESTTISWGSNVRDVKLVIYDLHGKIVYNQLFSQTDHADLALRELISGMYAVSITLDGNLSENKRMVIVD